ncbi:MAG: MFS transporter [Burkholderiales bacterium]|nr:MFS transporter [Burkholderiales bacterium]
MPFIMATVLIDMISIGLIIPVLPKLVGSFEHSAAEQVAAYAWVAMAFSFANFIGSPILGALSDRYGRRPVLLVGFSGLALSFFVTGLATQLWMLIVVRLFSGAMQANIQLWMLIVVRLFSGAMQANIAVANAYVTDITPPEDRAKRFGMLGAMFGLGFILGPVLGGLLGGINLRLPFFVAGSLAIVNWLYGFFVLPESLPRERRQPFRLARANPVGSLVHLAQLKGMGALLAVVTLTSLAQFILQQTWAVYTPLKFGWTTTDVGWSLCAVGAMSVLVQGVLVGRLARALSVQRLVILGLLSSALAYLAWGAATQGWMMYAVIACNVLGFAGGASLQTLVANAAEPKSQGQTMGAVAGLSSLTAVLAPVIGPLLLAAVANLPRHDWRLGMPYYLCAALQLGAMAMTIRHFRRLRADSTGAPVAARP